MAARTTICCPSNVAALSGDDCICDSFAPLKTRIRAAWVWSICRSLAADAPTCTFEGYRDVAVELVILCFPVQTPLPQPSNPLPTRRKESGEPSNSFFSQTTVHCGGSAGATLTGADGPKSAPTDAAFYRTRAVMQYSRGPLIMTIREQLQQSAVRGLPFFITTNICDTMSLAKPRRPNIHHSRVPQLQRNVDHCSCSHHIANSHRSLGPTNHLHDAAEYL